MEGLQSNAFDEYELPEIKVESRGSKYTAIIVEPRKHKALEFVLNNFIDNLDKDWNIVIIHGKANQSYVYDIVERTTDKSRIQTVNIGVNNLTISQYSEMFYNPKFYDYIPTEMFLVFQTDSMIIKENKTKIYDYMDYDYVGAPWPATMGILGKMIVGNGGLSLRRKSKMVKLLKYKKRAISPGSGYGKYIAEDQFFCGYYIPEENVNTPSFDEAKFFSIESVYSNSPFGIHKPWLGIDKKSLKMFIEKYPEVSSLLKLNDFISQ